MAPTLSMRDSNLSTTDSYREADIQLEETIKQGSGLPTPAMDGMLQSITNAARRICGAIFAERSPPAAPASKKKSVNEHPIWLNAHVELLELDIKAQSAKVRWYTKWHFYEREFLAQVKDGKRKLRPNADVTADNWLEQALDKLGKGDMVKWVSIIDDGGWSFPTNPKRMIVNKTEQSDPTP